VLVLNEAEHALNIVTIFVAFKVARWEVRFALGGMIGRIPRINSASRTLFPS